MIVLPLSRMPTTKRLLLILLFLTLPTTALAHGSMHSQIEKLNQEIKEHPQAYFLYWKRGELYREHEDYDKAAKDFQKAEILQEQARALKSRRPLKEISQLNLSWARLYLGSDQPQQALAAVDKYLKIENKQQSLIATAHLIRARCLSLLSQPDKALEAYTQSLKLAKHPSPDLYLEIAVVHEKKKNDIPAALVILDQGLTRLGLVGSLQDKAIELEVARKNFPAALARQQKLLNQARRKETRLFQRGQIHHQAGDKKTARESYDQALQVIAGLPTHHRRTTAIEALVKSIKAQLRKLKKKKKTKK